MLKNTVFKSGSYALGIPVGSSSIGPDSAVVGQTRWNASPPEKLEYYDGTQWQAVAHEGSVTIVKDSFTGDNLNNVFGPMTYTYTAGQETQVIAVVNNVIQNPGVGFTFDGVGFAAPQPYASWTLNTNSYLWEAPTPMPTDGIYEWNEENLAWEEVTLPTE
jgi:hypothetical protein